MEKVGRHNSWRQAIRFNGRSFYRYAGGKHPNYFYFKSQGSVEVYLILHREIYKSHHGDIPKGHIIHHVDGDPLNNEISNLVAVTPSEHAKIHGYLSKWNRSALGKQQLKKVGFSNENWHARRAKVVHALRNERRVCTSCGKDFIPTNTHQKFCTSPCYHRWQYKAEENKIELSCQNCAKGFMGNKYTKPKSCSKDCAYELSKSNRRKDVEGVV